MARRAGPPSGATREPRMTGELSEAVTAAQAGDEDAFRFLYRSLQPGLLRYLTALVGADAEDVASETWLQISRDLPNFTGGEFRAWTVTIARNRAMDHLRRLRRRPSLPVPVQALTELAGDGDTAERAGETISTEAALALIATLPPREAEAVLLRAVIGLDAESAGRVLGRRAGAVRTAAHRGLRRLATVLDRQMVTAPPSDGAVPTRAADAPDGVSAPDAPTTRPVPAAPGPVSAPNAQGAVSAQGPASASNAQGATAAPALGADGVAPSIGAEVVPPPRGRTGRSRRTSHAEQADG